MNSNSSMYVANYSLLNLFWTKVILLVAMEIFHMVTILCHTSWGLHSTQTVKNKPHKNEVPADFRAFYPHFSHLWPKWPKLPKMYQMFPMSSFLNIYAVPLQLGFKINVRGCGSWYLNISACSITFYRCLIQAYTILLKDMWQSYLQCFSEPAKLNIVHYHSNIKNQYIWTSLDRTTFDLLNLWIFLSEAKLKIGWWTGDGIMYM